MAIPSDFNEQSYLQNNPDVAQAIAAGTYMAETGGTMTAADHYQFYGQGEGRTYTGGSTGSSGSSPNNKGDGVTLSNITDFASDTVKSGGSNIVNSQNGTSLQSINSGQSGIDVSQGMIDGSNSKWGMNNISPVNSQQVDTTATKPSATYEVDKTEQKVADNQMQAAAGTVSDGALISNDEIAQHDMKGVATGLNADGTVNYVGQALNKYASLKLDDVDPKATVKGQLDQLQKDFTDANGNPKIPVWAQGVARNVGKIAAFSGMTGTAATSAMASALMESSISVATQDAQFFQTVTLQNLSNEQQSVINTANVLSKMEEQNVDNRMAAAIQNSKNFMEMDLTNLSNEQQERVINNQARIQSILEDSKAENTKRMFVAESTNELNKFYDQLNTQIKQFNSSQNLDAQKFNATMADSREKFYKEMQFNIDVSNVKWRQTVELQEDQQAFEAATIDVKNMVDITTSQLNQIWDRSDALLDYAWKTSENQKDRDAKLGLATLQADAASRDANMTALGSLAGTFIGSETGQQVLGKVFSGIF